jgi:hypothetical protein
VQPGSIASDATGALNHERIKYTMAVRMLDNVIDLNSIRLSSRSTPTCAIVPWPRHMGIQDALYISTCPSTATLPSSPTSCRADLVPRHPASEPAEERAHTDHKAWADRGIFPVDTCQCSKRARPVDRCHRSHLDWTLVREHVKSHGMRTQHDGDRTATIANIAGCVPNRADLQEHVREVELQRRIHSHQQLP